MQVGVDLVAVERIAALLNRYGDRFKQRVFTPHEIATCGDQPERLAARFAAKEAASKALGTGIGRVSWRDIEVVNDAWGKPELVLRGRAGERATELGLQTWALSLSHTKDQAIAVVIAD